MDTVGHSERTLIKVEARNEEEEEQDHCVVHSFFTLSAELFGKPNA